MPTSFGRSNSLSATPPNPALDSWTEGSSKPCNGWAGVTCDSSGGIIELNLTMSGLEGTMPKDGWTFPGTLLRLDLSDNSLTGPISPKWRLPEGLQLLDLRYNLLSGTVPGAWVLPEQLLELKLTDNFFAGVASNWSLPPNLDTLLLAYNSVPAIPTAWAGHDKLRFLDHSSADISGPFPGKNLPGSLKELRMPLNSLTGSVPAAEELPPTLESLWLGTNMLSGSLPDAWQLPVSLRELRLDNNPGLEGPLPGSWAANRTELSLFLFNNSMTGTLPAWEGAEGVNIAVAPGNNWTCGEVPSSPLYSSASDFVQRLSGYTVSLAPLNQLPSCAPPAEAPALLPASNASDAELLLDMKATFTNGDALLSSWTGEDPCDGWIGVTCDSDGNVFILSLSRGLRGSIPPGGWVLTPKLSALDLSMNELTGAFPEGWVLPPQLARLELDYNQLNGTLPAELLLPDSFSRLYLGKNRLSGSLPHAWELPPQLLDLGLDNNQLTGPIPSNWTLPSSLDKVCLFNNSLTGTLPGYPNADSIAFVVSPGNTDLCGDVPFSPQYWWVESPDYGPGGSSGAAGPLNASSVAACSLPVSLPPSSPPPATTSPAGSNTGVLVGAVAGAVCALVAAAVLAWWCWRRKRQSKPDEGKEAGKGSPRDSATEQGSLPFEDLLLSVLLTKLGPKAEVKPPNEEDWSLAAVSASTPEADGLQHSGTGFSSAGTTRVNPKAWTVAFHDLELIKPIGEGSFGRVYLGRYFETQVAVKILLNTGIGLDNAAAAAEMALSLSNPILFNLQQEATLMASLRHPNIVGFLGVCLLPPIVVTEFCSRGSLTDVLRAAKGSRSKAAQLDWGRRISMAMDAAKGMLYLHSRSPPILHRDLKSPNLLVDKNWSVKVCDFNLSKIMEMDAQVASSMAASNPRWLAPEILHGQGASFASDVYSFGVVMWELLAWELPWAATNQFQVIKTIASGGRPPIPPREQLPDGGGGFEQLDGNITLLNRCWAQDPDQRPTFAEVIAELRALAAEAPKKGSKRDSALGAKPSPKPHKPAANSTSSSQSWQQSSTPGSSAPDATLGASLEGSMSTNQPGSASASLWGDSTIASTVPSTGLSGAQHSRLHSVEEEQGLRTST